MCFEADNVSFSVVVLTSRHQFRVGALAGAFSRSDLEHLADGAAVLPRHAVKAHEELAAVVVVGVAREGAHHRGHARGGARDAGKLVLVGSLLGALVNLVLPRADAGRSVVGKAWTAVVFGGLSGPAGVEHGA